MAEKNSDQNAEIFGCLKILLSAIVGAIISVTLLLRLSIIIMSPATKMDIALQMGSLGLSMFCLFWILPLFAIYGAFYGILICKLITWIKQGKMNKASNLCLIAGFLVLSIYLIFYFTTSSNSPPSPPAPPMQDLRDALSLCVPLVAILPVVCTGLILKFRNVSKKNRASQEN